MSLYEPFFTLLESTGVRLKEIAGRPQDLEDIAQLRRIWRLRGED